MAAADCNSHSLAPCHASRNDVEADTDTRIQDELQLALNLRNAVDSFSATEQRCFFIAPIMVFMVRAIITSTTAMTTISSITINIVIITPLALSLSQARRR